MQILKGQFLVCQHVSRVSKGCTLRKWTPSEKLLDDMENGSPYQRYTVIKDTEEN